MALELALRIRQAALQGRAHDLDVYVKQIGCDNDLGLRVARAAQVALKDANVVVQWIPRSHEFAGSLLVLKEHWGVAFCSAPFISPEAMSLRLNDLALKRENFDELFVLTPASADEALHIIFADCKAVPTKQ